MLDLTAISRVEVSRSPQQRVRRCGLFVRGLRATHLRRLPRLLGQALSGPKQSKGPATEAAQGCGGRRALSGKTESPLVGLGERVFGAAALNRTLIEAAFSRRRCERRSRSGGARPPSERLVVSTTHSSALGWKVSRPTRPLRPPLRLDKPNCPPWASAKVRTMARPRPEPDACEGAARKNRSVRRGRAASSTPGP